MEGCIGSRGEYSAQRIATRQLPPYETVYHERYAAPADDDGWVGFVFHLRDNLYGGEIRAVQRDLRGVPNSVDCAQRSVWGCRLRRLHLTIRALGETR